MSDTADGWRRCSNCKEPIGFERPYWVCSVSTCNRKRTGLVFCSTSCWDAHLPVVRHREAWALEERDPSRAAAAREREQASATPASPQRAVPTPAASAARPPRRVMVDPGRPASRGPEVPREVLVVASRLKKYVRDKHDMNTSENVLEVLSDRIRALCDAAIRNARADGRKTLMKRDF